MFNLMKNYIIKSFLEISSFSIEYKIILHSFLKKTINSLRNQSQVLDNRFNISHINLLKKNETEFTTNSILFS